MNPNLINRRQIPNTRDNKPNPSHGPMRRERTQHARAEHDQVRNDGDEQMRPRETGKQRQVDQRERVGQEPVDVAHPEDLAVVVLRGIRDVLVWLLDCVVLPGDAFAGGHGHVGDEGDGRHD